MATVRALLAVNLALLLLALKVIVYVAVTTGNGRGGRRMAGKSKARVRASVSAPQAITAPPTPADSETALRMVWGSACRIV